MSVSSHILRETECNRCVGVLPRAIYLSAIYSWLPTTSIYSPRAFLDFRRLCPCRSAGSSPPPTTKGTGMQIPQHPHLGWHKCKTCLHCLPGIPGRTEPHLLTAGACSRMYLLTSFPSLCYFPPPRPVFPGITPPPPPPPPLETICT